MNMVIRRGNSRFTRTKPDEADTVTVGSNAVIDNAAVVGVHTRGASTVGA